MVRRASGCKIAFELLLFPRVPLRYALPGRSWRLVPAGGRGRPPYGRTMAFGIPVGADALIGPLQKPHQPPGQRQRKEEQDVSPTSPGQTSPQGQHVSVPDCRAGPPAIPRRRQEVCACADRPAEAFFLFGPCTARFSFGKTKRGPRRAPRGGERRSKGAGAVFAAGGNGAERTLRRRHGGCILAGPAPWREQTPRGRHRGGRDLPVRDGEFSPIRVTNPPPAGHT